MGPLDSGVNYGVYIIGARKIVREHFGKNEPNTVSVDGVTGTNGHMELSGDLVFKKPVRLSSTSELMIGLGPTVSRVSSGPDEGSSHGIEVVFDFMFWPHKNTGWYLEPSWSRTSHSGDQTAGLTGGILFGWH